jgi:predicted nucleic acid-binding protein
MIAVDTSSLVAFLEGQAGSDTDLIQSALDHQQLALPPVVLTEILSDPAVPRGVRTLLAGLPILDLEPGFWERAGVLRASVLKQKKKARVADSLIAQSCLDQSTPLVTRDRDFRHFAKAAGLSLL